MDAADFVMRRRAGLRRAVLAAIALLPAVAQARNDRLRRADGGADFRVAQAGRGDLEEGGFDVHAPL